MTGAANPAAFGKGATLAMILIGFITFVFLLSWMGTGERPANNGGAHAQGKGIAGYAALAALLNAEGTQVSYNRVPDQRGSDELMVLTPLADADVKAMKRLIEARRSGIGPTMLIVPKWVTSPLRDDPRAQRDAWTAVVGAPRAPAGWTSIFSAELPQWQGLLGKVEVNLSTRKGPSPWCHSPFKFNICPVYRGTGNQAGAGGWRTADGRTGALADDHFVVSGGGTDAAGAPLVPLVRSGDGRILAAYFADGGSYPALEAMAGVEPAPAAPTPTDKANADDDDAVPRQPLVIVFEPDLMNNYGLDRRETAALATRLIDASAGRGVHRVLFDLSLAGISAPRNLLTLAFSPPFLAATICLIAAMALAIWRGFVRFGPALVGDRAIPAGKTVLVAGTAAMLLRARRHRLIVQPYADAARERLIVALGLPRRRPTEETDAAIARIQQAMAPDSAPFATVAARLAAARTPRAIAEAAAQLHSIEQALAHHGHKGGS